jgi:hypothetical protein
MTSEKLVGDFRVARKRRKIRNKKNREVTKQPNQN